jgi:predicted MFS family arabinose efflux permease
VPLWLRMAASAYSRLLRIPLVRQPLLGSVLGRLPIASLGLAIVLMIRHATGSFATAGLVSAGFAIASAVALPVQGRLIDRLGQTRVLIPGAIAHPLALVALVVAAESDASTGVLIALGALAGGAVPAVPSSMRTLWRSMVPSSDMLLSAYSIDAVLFEVAFIVGPLLTGLLVAVASPAAAVLANAGFALAGGLTYALSPAARRWRNREKPVHWSGALRAPGIAVLIFSELTFGLAVGAMEISVTAFATGEGSPGLAGVLIAVQAAASMVGGLIYGARERSADAAKRYPLLLFLITLGFVPLLLISSIANAIPLMALSGFAFAPASAVVYLLVENLSPPGSVTEASTWMITAVICGIAAGNGIAGQLVEGGHAHRGFAVSVAAGFCGWLAVMLGRNSLGSQPAPA